jgi:hypothetical protein
VRRCREQEQAAALSQKDRRRSVSCTFARALKLLKYGRTGLLHAPSNFRRPRMRAALSGMRSGHKHTVTGSGQKAWGSGVFICNQVCNQALEFIFFAIPHIYANCCNLLFSTVSSQAHARLYAANADS